MSVWKDEEDFMRDVESISEFFVPGDHNKPANKFVFKSSKESKPHSPWYESDSDDSVDYSFGRGKKRGNSLKNPGEATNHLDVMREIQMQVRSAVGNRYNNEVLESYYNVAKDEPPNCESPTSAPKEVSIIYAKEQNLRNDSPGSKSPSVAENICRTAAKLNDRVSSTSPVASSSCSSASSSPKKGRYNNRKKFSDKNNYRNGVGRAQPDYSFPFSSKKRDVDVYSKDEFPPL